MTEDDKKAISAGIAKAHRQGLRMGAAALADLVKQQAGDDPEIAETINNMLRFLDEKGFALLCGHEYGGSKESVH